MVGQTGDTVKTGQLLNLAGYFLLTAGVFDKGNRAGYTAKTELACGDHPGKPCAVGAAEAGLKIIHRVLDTQTSEQGKLFFRMSP